MFCYSLLYDFPAILCIGKLLRSSVQRTTLCEEMGALKRLLHLKIKRYHLMILYLLQRQVYLKKRKEAHDVNRNRNRS